MKIAITGASGYVGTRIADRFRFHGHEVISLTRRPCPAPWISYTLDDNPFTIHWSGIDALVHAAYDFQPTNWPEIVEKNVNPSIALLRAAHEAGVRKLIFISSMSSFDDCRSNYGKAKLLIENQVRDLGVLSVRPGLVWGSRSGGVMGSLEKLVNKTPLVPYLTGSGNLTQFLVHHEDLSEAIVVLAGEPTSDSSPVRTIAHATPVPLLSILKAIATRSGKSRLYLPISWRLLLAGLRCAEMLGLRASFRSDSLIGLVHGNPSPEITTPPPGIQYRSFLQSFPSRD